MGKITKNRILRRRRRVSSNIIGTAEKPRISIFRSNRYIFAQAVDDMRKDTLVSFSSHKFYQSKGYKKEKKTVEAKKVGIELSKKLVANKIKKAVFDRGKYSYKGRVKSLAEGLREGGIEI